MSLHEESLKNLCRKCGLKIKKDSHYQLKPVIIYKHTILSFYKLDITSDHQKVHPEYLCKSCYMVLYRLDLKTKNSFVIERSDKFFTFTEHTETCYVCNTLTKVGRNKKVPAINTNQQLKTIASKHGFDCYNENNKNYFVIVEINSCRQIVSKTLSLESNSMWRLIVLNREVPLSNNVIKSLPVHLNLQSADIIFSTISCVNICKGNNDFHYLIRNKFSDFKNFQSTSNEDVGIIEMEEGNTVDNFKVIRHKDCSLICSEACCNSCTMYRTNLRVMESRRKSNENQSSISSNSKKNDRYFSKSELLTKIKLLEKERKENLAKQQRMQKKLEKSIIEEGVVLEEEEHTIIEETYEKYGEENPFTEDSPQALLWQQQKIQAGLKDRRSMRWHPLIIRWCISLYLKSPSAYRHICSTPFLNLPCKNTVQKYINFTDPGCGFNKDVMYNLTKKIDLPNIKEHQRYVSIIVDEMKIKSGLAFSSSTGKLVGFSESGSINELLLNFENKYTENKGKSNVEDPTDIPLASYVTVLMVRGITSSLKYVFGHFASAGGLSSSQLYFTIWDGVRQLESVGLKVMAIVADGASPNRKFMRLHSWKSEENTKDGVIYWTWNECCPDRKMFFICDVPHLIKTTRNNLEKSHENSSSRSLMIDGQPLVWDQIIRLYDWDLGIDRDAVGLTMGHKLSEEHINLNSRTRMRVNLAVQVLS
ncbi:uncharacterized protein LOC136080809 isoform X2 [Hydra vulgaris]|uniref:Uncharacterized protein LOC136080809 isoform X2 n=1 Tax=Hydra vulgaris TaxID=6087 RepID=A0ABM4BXY1_HYDVU